MKIKAFLFDLDGVIVDTAGYHYKAWRKLANELGFDIDEEFNETLKGISRMDSLNAILKKGNIELTEIEKNDWAKRKNDWYLDFISQMDASEIMPGVQAFFDDFKQKNIRCALGSASKNAPHILEKIGLLPYFNAIVDGNSVEKSKPDPEVFAKGAELLGVAYENCLVFEDALAGIEAAQAIQMKTVGIGKSEILTTADVVFESFTQFTPDTLLTYFN